MSPWTEEVERWGEKELWMALTEAQISPWEDLSPLTSLIKGEMVLEAQGQWL